VRIALTKPARSITRGTLSPFDVSASAGVFYNFAGTFHALG
jgi:hypothetical protein